MFFFNIPYYTRITVCFKWTYPKQIVQDWFVYISSFSENIFIDNHYIKTFFLFLKKIWFEKLFILSDILYLACMVKQALDNLLKYILSVSYQ